MDRCTYISCNRICGHFRSDLFQFIFRISEATNDHVADAVPYVTAGKFSVCTGKVKIGVVLDYDIRFDDLTYGHGDVVVSVSNHTIGYLLKNDIFNEVPKIINLKIYI